MSDPTTDFDEPNLPFRGEIPIELEIELLGERSRRKAKIVYDYSPAWDYWDVESQSERSGTAEGSIGISVLADPEATGFFGPYEDGPYWLPLGIVAPGVLSEAQRAEIDDLIEEDIRRQDRANRNCNNSR